MERKPNYLKQMEATIAHIDEQAALSGKKPSLLLHACCAPCSSYVLECLSTHFNLTIYYYNPNIHPQTEYERRLNELKAFLIKFPLAVQNNIHLVEEEYKQEDFFNYTNVQNELVLQSEPEKGERCRRCYELRMKKSWNYAIEHQFNYFTTTLSISPHKDAEKINVIGLNLIPKDGTIYLPADFKKQNGYLRSLELSREYGLYRQDYCGCVYSMRNGS